MLSKSILKAFFGQRARIYGFQIEKIISGVCHHIAKSVIFEKFWKILFAIFLKNTCILTSFELNSKNIKELEQVDL